MHWRKKRPGWATPIAILQIVAMLLALGIFVAAMNSMASREPLVIQAPPYYYCNGPKETRHPRCDRD